MLTLWSITRKCNNKVLSMYRDHLDSITENCETECGDNKNNTHTDRSFIVNSGGWKLNFEAQLNEFTLVKKN